MSSPRHFNHIMTGIVVGAAGFATLFALLTQYHENQRIAPRFQPDTTYVRVQLEPVMITTTGGTLWQIGVVVEYEGDT